MLYLCFMLTFAVFKVVGKGGITPLLKRVNVIANYNFFCFYEHKTNKSIFELILRLNTKFFGLLLLGMTAQAEFMKNLY